ncbi:L-rhamnose mutarotase [Arenibacter sp. BSSL-BM3]|uniref:L-rhamnose mutarotase n=1 Tax=Arenibacter arenosicollis TaxID=2762274 RepID=A0ABR7QKK7_9FLAO|nr:L-rhamnose mutarotase [Arenibacter arenosicollis]MBC8767713.1 L-rhamnose mutarotase [Arenibacter arenosicollis]
MIRKAFKMKVYPDQIEEYTKRHNPIWTELEEVLKNHGVHNYSIFFDSETHVLFGYAELESEEKWKRIADTEICKKWWTHMAPIMETNEDNSPMSKDLKEVFHMP